MSFWSNARALVEMVNSARQWLSASARPLLQTTPRLLPRDHCRAEGAALSQGGPPSGVMGGCSETG